MRVQTSILLILTCAPIVFGQLDSNSVTVTASRAVNLQPDQVLFAVYVASGLNTSLDDVLVAVKGSGITIANFSGVATVSGVPVTIIPGSQGSPVTIPAQPELTWAFGLSAPFAKMKDTVAALTSLEQSIKQANNGLKLSFQVQGTQASADLQQSQTCNPADLLADARGQAQKLASAGGLTLGNILAMAGNTFLAIGTGVPVAPPPALLTASSLGIPRENNCALTVKFGLTRF